MCVCVSLLSFLPNMERETMMRNLILLTTTLSSLFTMTCSSLNHHHPQQLRFLRGGGGSRKLLSVDPKLMRPIPSLEQATLFEAVQGKGTKQNDGAGLLCNPMCKPLWQLPPTSIDPKMQTMFNSPEGRPDYALGMNPSAAATFSTYPPRDPRRPRLIPSYYDEKNPHVFRQPDPNSIFDRIALYSYAPYGSMANPRAVGEDKKGGFWPMVPDDTSVVLPPSLPHLRPAPFGVTYNYSPDPRGHRIRTSSGYLGASQGPYPNVALYGKETRPKENTPAREGSGIAEKPATKFENQPAKVEGAKKLLFLEMESKTSPLTNDGKLKVGSKEIPWLRYDYSWLNPLPGHRSVPTVPSQSYLGHSYREGSLMNVPPQWRIRSIDPPISMGPPFPPPPGPLV